MLNVNNTLIAGGNYLGDERWNKQATSLDQCFKLYQVVKGEAWLFSKKEKFKLSTGQIYFINGFKIDKQCCPNSFEINWIHFMCDSVLIKQFLKKRNVVVKLTSNEIQNFAPVFNVFQQYFKNQNSPHKFSEVKEIANYLRIQSLISLVVAEFVRNFNFDFYERNLPEDRIYKSIEFINANFKQHISLKKLAGLCFISENYFHSLFKKTFEITPNNYILQLRMNEAINLLANTNLSVKEIALNIGYFDAAYFSRTFSKYYKISPKQYRKSLNYRIP